MQTSQYTLWYPPVTKHAWLRNPKWTLEWEDHLWRFVMAAMFLGYLTWQKLKRNIGIYFE